MTRKNEIYWFWVILFIPFVGCLLYFITQVLSKKDFNNAQKNLSNVFNPTKKITDLEKRFKFSDTFENQVALADAYLEAEQYSMAIENYEASLSGTFENDFYATSKLQEAYYHSSRFDESIACAEKITEHDRFKKTDACFLYGLALEKTGKPELAEKYLKVSDAPYCKYQERIVLGEFYIRNEKPDQAKQVLQEVVKESERMSKQNYRTNVILIKKAKEILATLT